MNANNLKFIACVSMLIDHAGLLLFPQLEWMRYIGRLAMPIFGFFVAEGARCTSNRLRYFLRMLALGIACQLVYTAEEILSGGIRSVYLNILFTLSLSMLVCFAYVDFEKSLKSADKARTFFYGTAFVLSVFFVIVLDILCTYSYTLFDFGISFDYGAAGALLPLFAVVTTNRRKQLTSFAIGLILFVLCLRSTLWYIWFALLTIPILALYNGKRGSRKFKYAFYVFYPLHLGVLYLIDIIF